MSKVEKQFKQDFENSVQYQKSFDMKQLEDNKPITKKRFNPLPIIIPIGCIAAVVIPCAIGFYAITHPTVSRLEIVKKHYSGRENTVMNYNTFKKINNVTQPLKTSFDTSMLKNYSETEMDAYLNFSDEVFKQLNRNSNSMYSPITLYGVLNNLSNGVSDTTVSNELYSLLGMSTNNSNAFYKKVVQSNYFVFENGGTSQLTNGAFLTNKYDYNQAYINKITNLYCEAYQMDFLNDNDVNQMLRWVKDAMRYEEITKEDIGLRQDGHDVFALFSFLYFNSEWDVIFNDEMINDKFHLSDGTSIDLEYMSHDYFVECAYEYDDYYTFEDKYSNMSKITYVVPKDENSIYDVISNNNIFKNNDNNKVTGEYGMLAVNLTMPEFSLKQDIDFEDIMTNLHCDTMYSDSVHAFDDMFSNIPNPNTTIYLSSLKQKSIINLSKKGTEIKNYTVAIGADATAPMPIDKDTLTVNIIKDMNGIPLFSGIVDNPSL